MADWTELVRERLQSAEDAYGAELGIYFRRLPVRVFDLRKIVRQVPLQYLVFARSVGDPQVGETCDVYATDPASPIRKTSGAYASIIVFSSVVKFYTTRERADHGEQDVVLALLARRFWVLTKDVYYGVTRPSAMVEEHLTYIHGWEAVKLIRQFR